MQDSYSKIFSDKQTIMCVFAHPDDTEIFAGGTIARLRADGKRVVSIKVTNGNKGSRQEEISATTLTNVRDQEDAVAMTALNIPVEYSINLGIDDGAIEDSIEHIGQVVRMIRKYKPDILITHNPENVLIRFDAENSWVNHRDHQNCGKIVTYAAYPYSRDLLFFPEHFQEGLESHIVSKFLYVDYYGHPDEVAVDITDTFDTKVAAISAHESQFSADGARELAEFVGTVEGSERKFERFWYVAAD